MHNNELIALVFKRDGDCDIKEGLNFLTDSSASLQTGILSHPRGHKILPHIHNIVERKVFKTQEMLYVESGKMRVCLLTENNQKICEEILCPGDLILLLEKGHSMEMLEDSRVIYVKQGPYLSKEVDKIVF